MSGDQRKSLLDQFSSPPWWYKARGFIMLVLGCLLAWFSIVASDVQMLGMDASWLPMTSLVMLIMGGLRCFDAYLNQESKGFFLNLQNGILDAVIAILILFNLDAEPSHLSLLISGYLISAGMFRIVVTFLVEQEVHFATRIGGAVSLVLGVLIALQVFSTTPWLLSLALSIEIGLRGWVLIVMATLKTRQQIVI